MNISENTCHRHTIPKPKFDKLNLMYIVNLRIANPILDSATRIFRGKKLKIKVENPNNVQKGIAKMLLNEIEINGNIINSKLLNDTNEVIVTMG